MKGKFVVIEGADASGKSTQFNLLERRYKSEGIKYTTSDFPRYYESIWGKMVGDFLTGKYGKFEEVDPHIFVLPYMLDQYTWSRDVGRPWIEQGGHILSNRYFTSNVHQIAKLKTRSKKMFRDWLWPAGYNELSILEPDLVVFLDVPPKLTKVLNKRKSPRSYLKGRKQDLAERNWKHQEASYREYLHTVKNTDYWIRIRCTTKGSIDPAIEIHEKVWNAVAKVL